LPPKTDEIKGMIHVFWIMSRQLTFMHICCFKRRSPT